MENGDRAEDGTETDRRPGRRTTIKDVAAALGLSVMTVSNAYNRPDQIAPATRERVLAEAKRLGYTGPHPTARSLRRRRTGVIGLLIPAPLSYTFSDPGTVLFTQGISLASEAARLGLLLLSGSSPQDPAMVGDAAVDGIIAIAMPENDPLVATTLRRQLPLVLVDSAPYPGAWRVGIDDAAAALSAAEHLLELGHRRIGVIALGERRLGAAGPPGSLLELRDEAEHPIPRDRLYGYAAALAGAGVSLAATSVYRCPHNTPEDGAAAAHSLLTGDPRPTALLVMSDQLAFGALNAARALGLRVPDDLSVVGFDDVPVAAWIEPALTTVRQDQMEKGRRAAELLLASLQGEIGDEPAEVVLPTALVIRASTAPPRSP